MRKEDLRRRSSLKASPQSWPLGSHQLSHQPWPPAAVFLIEARCGPDALGGSGGQGHEEGSIPGPLPPHQRGSTGTLPAAGRGWEPPTLFPGLLTQKPLQGGSLQNQILSPTLLGIWSPLDGSHSVSTSALLSSPPCWRRKSRRKRRRERLGELAISSWGRTGVPCTVPQSLVGEGDLRKLRG